MIQFLFDEDVTPALRDAANVRGYNAHHVQYRGWKGRKDSQILAAVDLIEDSEPPLDMVNTVLLVKEDATIQVFTIP